MTDTHTHLYMPQYEGETEAVVKRAIDAGVQRMVFPCVGLDSLGPMTSLAAKFPGHLFNAVGLHPSEVAADWEDQLAQMHTHLSTGGFVAIGEVGIDLYWDQTWREQQMLAFERQVEWARKHQLPVIIHCRQALDETLEVLGGFRGSRQPQLIFHSFTGSPHEAERILTATEEPVFGINGVVTFKNAPELRDALHVMGLQRLMLETDSPYLAPVPHRGQRNESAYLVAVRDRIADTLGVTPEEVERTTDATASRIFALP